MTLVNPIPWIRRAQHEGFAIGAFNANTMEQVQAIVAAAQIEDAPAIIQVSHHALQHVGDGNVTLGLRYMAEIGRVAAQSVRVPIGLHLDHANESEVIQALSLGFTSVMFDGGEFSFAENIKRTIKLRQLAHSINACLEAEMGDVPRADSAGNVDDTVELTDPADAAEFVRATNVDTLAIALGSVHAVRQKEVELNLDQLKLIREIVDIPLVLHGSSGVKDEYVAQGIALGLCKVNVATQLIQAFTLGVRGVLANADEIDPRRYLGPARDAMFERVRERIQFFGSTGKA
jgi:fructose-bisphosphate aldolase class II